MLCLAAAAGAVSCVQDTAEPEYQGETVRMVFTGLSDENVQTTKTTLHTDEVSVHWSNDDRIMVFAGGTTGVVSEKAELSSDPKVADFTVETTLADTYHAVYPPYEKATYSADYGHITAMLPTVQTPVGGSFADNTNLAIARSEGDKLHFRNVGAILAVKNPTNYASSIKIVSRDEKVKMSGETSLSFNDGEPVVVRSDNAVSYVELKSGLDNTKDQIFNALVYPGNYSAGFDVIFTSGNTPYKRAVYSSSKALELGRNDNFMLFNLPDGKFGWNSIAGPTSVSTSYGGWGAMNVSWTWNYTIASGETDPRSGYVVYVRKSGDTANVQEIKISDKSTMTTSVSGLTVDSKYDFGVQVTMTEGKPSEIVWAKDVWINGSRCVPPTPLTIEQISETQATFTWKDNTGAEKQYMIWKKEISGGQEIINTAVVDANTTTYTTGVTAGKTYKFGIQALHKDSSDNDSDIVYFDPFVAMTWEDLQKVDMGSDDCLEPVQVAVSLAYYSDAGQQATVTWDCYSGAATGYQVYFRESTDPEWTKSHYSNSSVNVGKDIRTYTFGKIFEYGKTYVIGVQALHGTSVSRNSDIVDVEFSVTKASTSKYDWEAARSGVPVWADMTLCYGGNAGRTPELWDQKRFASHALYTDESGQEHYLFDAFLALEFEVNGRTLNYDGETDLKCGRREEWTQLINYWFNDTYGFQALDDCLADAATRIGAPSTKRYVIFVLPDPVYCEVFKDKNSSKTYWGKYDDGTSANFSTEDGRIKAYKWMIDQVRARFAAKKYRHIELAGFYILSETLSHTYNSEYKNFDTVIPKVAEYCHKYNEGLYWIPYSYSLSDTGTKGHNATLKNWASYGFDHVTYQPNAYWREGKFYNKTWSKTYEYLGLSGVGMEFEFEGTHGEELSPSTSILAKKTDGTENSMGETNKTRFREYMTNCKSKGYYGSKRLVLYTGTNGWYELATSEELADKTLYHETAKFFLNNPLKK